MKLIALYISLNESLDTVRENLTDQDAPYLAIMAMRRAEQGLLDIMATVEQCEQALDQAQREQSQ